MTNTTAQSDKATKINAALLMHANGASLFAIAQALGVTKEWLRTYAGLTDRR